MNTFLLSFPFDAALPIVPAQTVWFVQSEPNQGVFVNFSAGVFSPAIPWNDSPDGCRSSYINPRERLEQSPELAALQPSMKPIPQPVLQPQ